MGELSSFIVGLAYHHQLRSTVKCREPLQARVGEMAILQITG